MGVFLKNGNWYIDYRLPNGKRHREKVGSSKKLAETVLAKRRVEIAEGKFLDVRKNVKIKFEEFANDFLNIHSKANKKSWKSDLYNLQSLKKYFGGKFLFTITIKDIEQFNTVRELLGHKDIRMTLRYSHLSPSFKRRAVDILGQKMDTFWTLSPNTESQSNDVIPQIIDINNVKPYGA